MFRFLHNNPPLLRRVEPFLIEMANQKYDPPKLIKVLQDFQKLTFVNRSYSQKDEKFSLAVLAKYDHTICSLYAQIAKFILTHKPEGVPLFLASTRMEHTFRKHDILLILCLMSTFLVPPQEYEGQKKLETQFNHLKSFGYIFSNQKSKTTGILEYLKQELKETKPTNLTIKRMVTEESAKDLLKKCGNQKMSKLTMSNDEDDIESHYGSLKVDFANKYIGGGSLIHGSVQEEIMFSVHPEMYASMLLCERMADNEALVFIGFSKYFNNEGYGYNVRLTGRNQHKYDLDMQERPQQYITAIDAINFHREKIDQYSQSAIDRELLKAYTGFNVDEAETITTGNWGCGVFGGDLQLKILIQWMAASLAQKELIYCPFGKTKKFVPQQCLEKLGEMSILDVFKIVIRASKKREQNKWVPKTFFQEILLIINQK